jgi:hypothetical protein
VYERFALGSRSFMNLHQGWIMPPSADELGVGDMLRRHGVSRRGFIKYCTAAASAMALPPWMGPAMAQQLQNAARPSVIYLSFQECTGCFESFTRSFAPTMESLIFNVISLDYDDTLMAAAGNAAASSTAPCRREREAATARPAERAPSTPYARLPKARPRSFA